MRLKPSFVLIGLMACGGAVQSVAPAPQPSTTPPPVAQASSTATAAATAPSSSATTAYVDLDTGTEPHLLEPLFTPTTLPSFPKATVSEADCAKGLEISGSDARKDYDVVAGRCGAPTGAAEYARPAMGSLHSDADKRDTYRVKIAAGLCYRFIGVADGTIMDLDVVITHGNGDVIGEDKTTGPVVVLLGDKAWCVDDAGDMVFDVVVKGVGTGHYVFGVWGRPKS
jgi:hypothetical protein